MNSKHFVIFLLIVLFYFTATLAVDCKIPEDTLNKDAQQAKKETEQVTLWGNIKSFISTFTNYFQIFDYMTTVVTNNNDKQSTTSANNNAKDKQFFKEGIDKSHIT
ncbi:hypothetical protein ABK040_009890 [Willaertia magna]